METMQISNQRVRIHRYNTLIVGAGAAGMNAAVHLYEFMLRKGVEEPQRNIAVVTAGLPLGASRMSGSDKQTYYKMGTSAQTPDSAVEFSKSLTAGGCCHEDLALAEGIGSLREFYHLARAGVPFPHDPLGSYVGYKTDHDPYERATSAGPKTSKFMSECLEREVRGYGMEIFDRMDAVELITQGGGAEKRIVGLVVIHRRELGENDYGLHLFCFENLILAAGGPGEMYKTTVYPKGQLGMHGLAFHAGLAAENLTESQFGLASIKFRWNVSGTYMQVIPRIYSTDVDGGDEREFLTEYFDSTKRMATDIFLKGYQWPFDPQKIENQQSSLIDVLVFNETQKGRRVFMDFLRNPIPGESKEPFSLDNLEPEAREYLEKAGALQPLPIDRLKHMNPPAIEIYKENGIDLYSEPLEIAVCAQHNNGGFAVDKWWQSTLSGTFVVGEMAGSHGVKRPGGSALNAGQTGGLRAAEFIANTRPLDPVKGTADALKETLGGVVENLDRLSHSEEGMNPAEALTSIQERMTASAGHIRRIDDARRALAAAMELHRDLYAGKMQTGTPAEIVKARQAQHLSLSSVAYLKAVVELLAAGSGSRGSHLVLAEDGAEVHPDVTDPITGKPLRYKPENESLRSRVQRLTFDPQAEDLFRVEMLPVRKADIPAKAFEPAWQDYREGRIYRT